MKICPKCGKELMDDMTICGYCGEHLETNVEDKITDNEVKSSEEKMVETTNTLVNNDGKPKKSGKAKMVIPIVALVFVVAAIGVYLGTAKSRSYSSAQIAIEQKDYEKAIPLLESIPDYEDSNSLLISCKYEYAIQLMNDEKYDEAHILFQDVSDYEDACTLDESCLHMIDVKNDTEAPVISGIDEKIDIDCGTDFNIKDYIKEHLSVSDNVTTDISDFSVICDNEAFDQGSGKIDTRDASTLECSVEVKDEAGNKGTINTSLVVNPIHITKKNLHNVIYDGEYGTVKISSFKHGYIDGVNQYEIIFDFKNKYDKTFEVYMPNTTSINDYQVGAYYTLPGTIAAGKSGRAECSVYDDDIPDDIGDFNQINSWICMKVPNEENTTYRVEFILDTNAIE